MNTCSLNDFTDTLQPWLNQDYIHHVDLHGSGHITFAFRDGIKDSYQISDCSRQQVEQVCKDLARQGITVHGLT